MLLQFSGQCVGVRHGANQKTNAPYTMIRFMASGEVFQLKAAGHIDIPAERIERKLDWVLEVEPKVYQGNTSFNVLRITGDAAKQSK